MKNHDPFDLREKVIVLTGGLGQLGRQYARALLAAGARVALLDVRVEKADRPVEFAGQETEGNLLLLPANVTSAPSLREALDAVQHTWGTPHGLINNAALDSPPDAPAGENGPFETYPEASWDAVMQTNLKGTLLPCQIFGAEMAAVGRGSIINISSIYGMVSPDQRIYEYRRENGAPFFKPVAYSVSKSGILNLTRYLATYWAKSGVRVNTLTLGGVFNRQDEQFMRGYCARVPLGRMAREDEYNGAVIFLLSDASSYMTGANLVIDGGWTAW